MGAYGQKELNSRKTLQWLTSRKSRSVIKMLSTMKSKPQFIITMLVFRVRGLNKPLTISIKLWHATQHFQNRCDVTTVITDFWSLIHSNLLNSLFGELSVVSPCGPVLFRDTWGPSGSLFIFQACRPVFTVQLSSGSNTACVCGSSV